MKIKPVFKGQHGLRAGWRVLIWLAIAWAAQSLVSFAIIALFHPGQHPFLDPRWLIAQDILLLGIPAIVATLIMARVERRTLADYYIPAPAGLLGRQSWFGWLWGIASVSLLMGMIAALGGYRVTGLAARGTAPLHWTLLWLVSAFLIGVAEEVAFRAYLLRTLADGIGFWPAAVLLSVSFGALHYFSKPYERWEDFASTGLLGLFLCFTIRRTGTLSFAIGWHAAFDWGAIYFYSGRNAGEFAVGRLFETAWPGSDRVTGGLLGPEASWLVFVLIAVLFLLFARTHRRSGSSNSATSIETAAR